LDALTDRAVVLDRSASDARLRVTGPDRIEWLQGLLTNDVGALREGEGCYAAYLTPQGRMIGDMRVLRRAGDVLLDVPGVARETLLSRLDQYIIMEDVAVADVSDDIGCVTVAGPEAADHLASHVGPDASGLRALGEYQHVAVQFGSDAGIVAATQEWGVPGFDVYLPRAAASRLLDTLHAAGLGELHPDAATTARIDAGRPRFGVDMDADTIPLEAGIEPRAISLTKGCYVGQEIIIRVLHRGQGRVARRIVRLVSTAPVPSADRAGDVGDSSHPWQAGTELRKDGKSVGRVTSVGWSLRRERLVALALVGRDAMADGTRLDVDAQAPWDAADVEVLTTGAASA